MTSKFAIKTTIEKYIFDALTFLYGVSYCASFPIINITNGPILIIIKNVFSPSPSTHTHTLDVDPNELRSIC